jgi:hypothetical protein
VCNVLNTLLCDCDNIQWERDYMVVGVYIMFTFLLAMMFADSIVLYLAVVLFIKPLESMARHLKRQVNTEVQNIVRNTTCLLYPMC